MTRTTARLGGLAALLAGALVLAGCADDNTDAADHASMMSSSSPADPSAGSSAEGTFNDADVAFARDMIPHHRQAVAMAQLAEDRAADARVRDLAARIEAAQEPEIDTLSGWLEKWGAGGHMGEGGMGGMGHGEGEGEMMPEQDMHALMNATGAEFDRSWLTGMIDHHRGAVQMAEGEVADGENPDAIALAESIRDSQTAEIAEMEQLLTELGG